MKRTRKSSRKNSSGISIKKIIPSLLPLFISLFWLQESFSFPLTFSDDIGKKITINQRPERVVSLVPSITEIICKIGASDTVRGIAYHDTYPGERAGKTVLVHEKETPIVYDAINNLIYGLYLRLQGRGE